MKEVLSGNEAVARAIVNIGYDGEGYYPITPSSEAGEVVAKARVNEVSPPGVVSMSFHFAESPTNQITNPALDPVAKIPELKVCAVRVERDGGQSP